MATVKETSQGDGEQVKTSLEKVHFSVCLFVLIGYMKKILLRIVCGIGYVEKLIFGLEKVPFPVGPHVGHVVIFKISFLVIFAYVGPFLFIIIIIMLRSQSQILVYLSGRHLIQ